ncbi:hypothetical protein ACFSYB_11505 [Litchfieldia salsa]
MNKILSIILWYPERLSIQEETSGGEKAVVMKVYDKSPLVNGTSLSEICTESLRILEKIRSMKKTYYYSY